MAGLTRGVDNPQSLTERDPAVGGGVPVEVDVHADDRDRATSRAAGTARASTATDTSITTGTTGTPASNAIRATPVLPLNNRPSGDRVPSG